ncbi:MAG: hybrid sensor histidine kinase/response regulator [Armatimonadota bacterium]
MLSPSRTQPRIQTEYMDCYRIDTPRYRVKLYALYKEKFRQRHFDVIICADDPALSFLLTYHDDLFPRTPVVFCGVNNDQDSLLQGKRPYTGVTESINLRETLDIALRLHPQTRQLVIIGDNSQTYRANRAALVRIMPEFRPRVSFKFLEGLPLSRLLKKIPTLPENSVLVLLSLHRGDHGEALDPAESTEQIAAVSRFPIYSCWDFFLGHGIVGGKLTSAYAQGAVAATMAEKVLTGTPVSAISVSRHSPGRYMFDNRKLTQFSIRRARLPKGSTIINLPISWYKVGRWVLWTGIGLLIALCVAVIVLLSTVMQRRRAEKAVRESEAKFRALFEHTLHGIAYHRIICDEHGKPVDYLFLDINDAFTAQTGLDRDTVIGKRVTEVIPGIRDGDFDWIGTYGKVALHGEAIQFEQYLPQIERWYSAIAYAPAPGYFVAAFDDITKRKHAEEALFEEKERLAVTLRSIGDGVITTDVEGRVVLLNAVAEQLTGWRQAEAIGKPLPEVLNIVHVKTRTPLESPVKQVLERGTIIGMSSQVLLIARDGTERRIDDSGAPICDKESRPLGVVLVFRDVTHQLALEEQLRTNEKLDSLGILAGGIAHDFNNLLAAILGNLSIARLHSAELEAVTQKLTEAEKACMRARDLTQQLLAFASGGAPVKHFASLADVVHDSAAFVLSGSRALCQFDIPSDLWPVEFDEGQISQVVQNLVMNADQAMPNGGALTVRVQNLVLSPDSSLPLPSGSYVKVEVVDQGAGIAPENMPRIFDPYFTTKAEGRGLGLATAYAIMKNHQGSLMVDSIIGQGAVFTFYLPATPTAIPEVVTSMSCPFHQGAGRVLIMDDEDIVRSVLVEMLSSIGFSATATSDGEKAIALYREAMENGQPFQAVIMDLTVRGGMGGKDAVVALREIDPGVRAIASSGYSTDPIMSNHRAYGFCAVLVKPYSLYQLQTALQQVISGVVV